MNYDGVLGSYLSSPSGGCVSINGKEVGGGGNYGDSVGQWGIFVSFKKGDVIKLAMYKSTYTFNVRFYNHPLFIKAK